MTIQMVMFITVFFLMYLIVLNIQAEYMEDNPLSKLHQHAPFAATILLLAIILILYVLKPCPS